MKNILILLFSVALFVSCASSKKTCCDKTQKTLKPCEKVEKEACKH